MLLYTLTVPFLASVALGHSRVTRRQDGPVDPFTASDCTYYDTSNDSSQDCDYFVELWGITHDDFVSYNPSVKADCSGIKVGNSYCVEVNNGQPRATSTTSGASGTASAKPSPTQSGLIDTCTTFYKAVAGDTCGKIVKKYGTFTEDQFIKWNPAVGDDCSAIWAQNYYCVGIPGTPTSRPSSTVTSTGTPAPSPTQSGLINTCTMFYKAVAGDSCAKIAKKYGTFTEVQFIKWNPAVGDDCAAIWAQNYYCVGIPGTPTSPPASATTTSTGTPGPSPNQPGIIDTCTRYYEAQSGDDCSSIVKQFGSFDFEDFLKWNPAVGADCKGLWAKTYYCVGVPGTPTTPTATAIVQPTCAGAPTPTQPGAFCKCKKWHKVVKDEGCETIEKRYGISNDDFAKWNTQVGKDCAALWLSYNVCVGV